MAKRKLTAKQRREQTLLATLQGDHGYMFSDLPRKDDRFTMLFRRSADGKHTITPGRKLIVCAPDASFLAIEIEASSKRKRARHG